MVIQNDEYFNALRAFSVGGKSELPATLEEYFVAVAKTGKTIFTWDVVQPAFLAKLEEVLNQVCCQSPYDQLPAVPNVENVKSDAMIERVMNTARKLEGIPFTIQRLCELLTNPGKHYKRSDKFLRAVEKNVMVVTTIGPDGRRDSSLPPHGVVNGDTSESELTDLAQQKGATFNGDEHRTAFPDTTSELPFTGNAIWHVNPPDKLTAQDTWSGVETHSLALLGSPSAQSSAPIITTLNSNVNYLPSLGSPGLWSRAPSDMPSSPTGQGPLPSFSNLKRTSPLPPLDIGTSEVASLDSLSPSINATMMGQWLNAAATETYGTEATSPSGSRSDSGSASFATMMPLQVPSLHSSSFQQLGGAGDHRSLVEVSSCGPLPSVEVAFCSAVTSTYISHEVSPPTMFNAAVSYDRPIMPTFRGVADYGGRSGGPEIVLGQEEAVPDEPNSVCMSVDDPTAYSVDNGDKTVVTSSMEVQDNAPMDMGHEESHPDEPSAPVASMGDSSEQPDTTEPTTKRSRWDLTPDQLRGGPNGQ